MFVKPTLRENVQPDKEHMTKTVFELRFKSTETKAFQLTQITPVLPRALHSRLVCVRALTALLDTLLKYK